MENLVFFIVIVIGMVAAFLSIIHEKNTRNIKERKNDYIKERSGARKT